MNKRTTTLVGGVLFICAAIIALGSSLRALDYLAAANTSPTLQRIVKLLLYPPIAGVVLLVGVILVVRAWNMPHDLTLAHRGTGLRSDPNIVVLATAVMPIDRRLQLAPDSGALGAIVRFRNDAKPSKEVGVMLATRAQIEFVTAGWPPVHAAGIWSEETSAGVNFAVGDTHDLVVAVHLNGETTIPELRPNGEIRAWNISSVPGGQVKVRLIGGIERTIIKDFVFILQVSPRFAFQQQQNDGGRARAG